MKLDRSPMPFLWVLAFLVLALPLMDIMLLGLSNSTIEKTITSSPNIMASSTDTCAEDSPERNNSLPHEIQ